MLAVLCDTTNISGSHSVRINRVSDKYIVKISDFGMSRDVYNNAYYRLDDVGGALLPVKWLALESLESGLFNSKTDVVSTTHQFHAYTLYYPYRFGRKEQYHLTTLLITGF